jgi:hypothetical protein
LPAGNPVGGIIHPDQAAESAYAGKGTAALAAATSRFLALQHAGSSSKKDSDDIPEADSP